jgi:cell division protein FtsN
VVAALLLVGVLFWTVRDSATQPDSPAARPPEAAHATALAGASPPVAPPAPVSPPAAPAHEAASAAINPQPNLTTAPAATAGRFLIIASSFRTRDRAAQVAAEIAVIGLPASVRSTSGWEQVVVGPYRSREEAITAQARLATAHITDAAITETAVMDGVAAGRQPGAKP